MARGTALNEQQRALLRQWGHEAAYARILADFRAWREAPVAA